MNPRLSLAAVLAHCGGDPATAVRHVAAALMDEPSDPEPYARLAELREQYPDEFAAAIELRYTGPVYARAWVHFLNGEADAAAGLIGALYGSNPGIAWADAPWFADPGFRAALTGDGLAAATLRITSSGYELQPDKLGRWFDAIDEVAGRSAAEALARMAILYRACGRIDESFAMCDRADAAGRVSFTEVVRAGGYRVLGDLDGRFEAFRRAVSLDPENWSLHLDLADTYADRGDWGAAAQSAARAVELSPEEEIDPRGAAAAYRARLSGSAADRAAFESVLERLPESGYRDYLVEAAQVRPADRPR